MERMARARPYDLGSAFRGPRPAPPVSLAPGPRAKVAKDGSPCLGKSGGKFSGKWGVSPLLAFLALVAAALLMGPVLGRGDRPRPA
jgi:hypothetical protein